MPKLHFTDAAVRKLKLPEGRGQLDYFETQKARRSLILTLNKSGRHAWSILFYVRGRSKRRKLGYFEFSDADYPKLNCNEAREAVRAFDVQAALTKARAGSFGEVAERWFDRHASKLRSKSELRRHLDSHILPAWRDRNFADVRRSDVNELLDKIQDGHGAGQADAVLATIRSVTNWQQARDENYISPIVKGMKRDKRKPDEKARNRILTDDEIRGVWTACDEMGQYGSIVRLCLLTGQRKAKIVGMRWSHIDLEMGIWTIATEPGEKGNPGTLQLPKMALDIVAAQPVIYGSPYVFASKRVTETKYRSGMFDFHWRHFNAWSQRKAELDRKLPAMPHWIIHDLRRTARSLMARAGVLDHIAERTIGHKIPGVEGVYNRHRYEQEKAQALDKLAVLLGQILNSKNAVVTSRRKQKASRMIGERPLHDTKGVSPMRP